MTLSLFDQFMSPALFGIPLIALALLFPWSMLPTPTRRWVNGRLLASQNSFLLTSLKQLMSPLNQPAHKWALLFMCLLIYLMALNMMGLLPYTFTPTTQLSLSLGLAVPLWLATVIIGMRNQPDYSLAHLLPEGTPTALIPILIIIETISLFIRPVALGVRLTANLTAGHLLIHLVATATMVMMTSLPPLAIVTGTLLFMLTLLEVAVAMIQAYVFVLLLTLYLQENV